MYPWSSSNLVAVDAKLMSSEDFHRVHKLSPEQEWIYDKLISAHTGKIGIKQVSGNKVGFTMSGVTATFNEGISLFIDNKYEYYYTSVIQKINWDEGYFDTLNSRYEFTFEPIPKEEL